VILKITPPPENVMPGTPPFPPHGVVPYKLPAESMSKGA
jgi:hypothetical protein